jgi:hypothetical protein
MKNNKRMKKKWGAEDMRTLRILHLIAPIINPKTFPTS